MAQKLIEIGDTDGLDELIGGTFRDVLVESGIISHDRFYELSEIYFALSDKSQTDDLKYIDEKNPVLEADYRQTIRALQVFDKSTIPGYFSHVEKHGTDITDTKEITIFNLLVAVHEIGDTIHENIVSREGTPDKILSELERFVRFMRDTVAKELRLPKSEIALEIQNRVQLFLTKHEKTTEGDEMRGNMRK